MMAQITSADGRYHAGLLQPALFLKVPGPDDTLPVDEAVRVAEPDP